MYFHTTAYPDIDCTIFPIRWTGTAHFGRTSSRFFLAAEISSHDILFFQTSALIADFADFHFSLYSVSNVGFRGKSGLSFDSNTSLRSFKSLPPFRLQLYLYSGELDNTASWYWWRGPKGPPVILVLYINAARSPNGRLTPSNTRQALAKSPALLDQPHHRANLHGAVHPMLFPCLWHHFLSAT